METMEAITARRSIRKFSDRPVTEETVNAVLAAAILAPSGKNRQPWRFVVVAGDEKRAQMIRVMREGIADTKAHGTETGSAIMTARVMEYAPVTIFVFNPEGVHPWVKHSVGQTFLEAVDTQSIGAAIQNMLLAAQEHGSGNALDVRRVVRIPAAVSVAGRIRPADRRRGPRLSGRTACRPSEAPAVRGRSLVLAGCFLFSSYTTSLAYASLVGEEANSPVCTKGDAR